MRKDFYQNGFPTLRGMFKIILIFIHLLLIIAKVTLTLFRLYLEKYYLYIERFYLKTGLNLKKRLTK